MTRRLTNQDAFDGAMLSLLNQGHSCVSASGRARYRGPRGKSAIGALIPDELYVATLEGKKVHHWLGARGSEYDALRERLGGVTPSLLDELEDLHDRIGSCMPSLYRHLAVDGAQRIAQSFKLSMSLVRRCAAYQHLRGPRVAFRIVPRAVPVPVVAPDLTSTPGHAPSLASAPDLAVTRDLASVPHSASAPVLALTSDPVSVPSPAPVPELALSPALTSAPNPVAASGPVSTPAPATPSAESPQDDLDLIARGIAKAIAAARGHDRAGS